MADNSLASGRKMRPRQPVQFTVRTPLGAAVLIALFAAAFKLPTDPESLQWAALATLPWITVVWIYRILHADAALLASILGAIAAGAGWIPFWYYEARGSLIVMIQGTIACGLAWGVGYSIVVLVVRAAQHVWRRGLFRRRAPPLSAPLREAPRLALAMASLQLLVLMVALVLCAGPQNPYGIKIALAATVVGAADFPLIGRYMVNFPPEHGSVSSFALTVLGLAVVSIPLHALLAYAVGYVLDRRNRV